MVVFFRTTSFRGRTPFVVVVGRVAPFREDQCVSKASKKKKKKKIIYRMALKSGDDEMFGRFRVVQEEDKKT